MKKKEKKLEHIQIRSSQNFHISLSSNPHNLKINELLQHTMLQTTIPREKKK